MENEVLDTTSPGIFAIPILLLQPPQLHSTDPNPSSSSLGSLRNRFVANWCQLSEHHTLNTRTVAMNGLFAFPQQYNGPQSHSQIASGEHFTHILLHMNN